ncbi:ABC transporter permease subunit [Mycoplasma nasistruthionis]|uniref:ABC transporter permease subunit n=1 Tax=Mycoplasma nasistruthionis TaxID=353852 RepID=A0A5B7XV00_9MOLU|nr:ABC transporter permease subunit [Mycoplasma nasistruthionis]QCZ36699.1 ABC transporter permease subunit [Mycoplasma nasistruthionis]
MFNLGYFTFPNSIRWKSTTEFIGKIFEFKPTHPQLTQNLWALNLHYFWITVKSVTAGTFIGFLLALITSYIGASQLHRFKLPSYLTRIIISALRAVPIIVFVLFFKDSFENYLASFVLYFWFTWLWMNRYLVDIIESSDFRFYYTDIKLGRSKFLSFYKNIFKSKKNKFLMNFLQAYESNIRWVTILGLVGITGLGFFFENYKNYVQSLGITLFFIALFVFLIELLLFLFNKVLLVWPKINNQNVNSIYSFKYNWRKYLTRLILIIYLVILVLSFLDLFGQKVYVVTLSSYFKSFLNFDFSVLNSKSVWLDYWTIIQQSYVAFSFSILIAILYSSILAEKVTRGYISLISKLLLSVIKIIPVFFWYLIFNPLSLSLVAINIALWISGFRALTKQIAESINALSLSQIQLLKARGYNKFQLYIYFILPSIKHQLVASFFFEYEHLFRNVITYGTFSGIGIYRLLQKYQQEGDYNKIFPLVFPAFIFIILLEISLIIYRNKDKVIRLKQQLLTQIYSLKQQKSTL